MLVRSWIKTPNSYRLYKKLASKQITTVPLLCKCVKQQNYRLHFVSHSTFVKKTNTVTQERFFCRSMGTEVPKNTANNENRNVILLSGGIVRTNVKERNQINHASMSTEELLEKLIAGLSTDIHQKNRVYKNDLIRVINKVKELDFTTKRQGLLLIKCCSDLLPDETSSTRLALLKQIWTVLKTHTDFDIEHYNELLKVYIANNSALKASSFIEEMGNIKPNLVTYELILQALAEAGDINQVTEVIANMKAQGLPATESVFNALIICQGKSGELREVQEVLTMMKSLKFEYSIETCTALVRAYAFKNKKDMVLNEMAKARDSGLQFQESNIMNIVKTLATVNMYEIIPKVLKFLPEEILKTPSISPYMQSVSTYLVFQNHPIPALEIYKCLPIPSFGPKDDQGLHGRSLVRDCVKASLPSSVISLIAQELMSSGRNPIAIQNACEAALQLGRIPLALDLFTKMKQLGMALRPHYFWPILLHTSKTYGEKGIMNTLSTMVTMEVKPDYETIMMYTLPYVSFTSPQNLMKKFQDVGLSATTVLTPMMETLLNTGQVRAASEICELFQGKVDAEIILRPLVKGFLTSLDVKSTIHILEDVTAKATDKSKDWVGRFLCVFMQHKKVKGDLSDFMAIVKGLKDTSLKISTWAADYCISRLPGNTQQNTIDKFKEALIDITDERLVDDNEMFVEQMPHPKNMNEESLRAHLGELEAKGMNTRGVLRKLLQQYCRDSNLPAALEIVDKCQKEGVFLSAGMKAAIFDLHVKLGELDSAELALADLNKTSPNFTLDEFKVIDFATLMVYRDRIKDAFELIKEQSKKRRVIGGHSISMNCWRLLDAVAARGGPEEARQMFQLLTRQRYCKPTNTALGPLVRAHLLNDNLEAAVQEFTNLANKYSKTPLKHELLCKILIAMGDGGAEEAFIINEKTNGGMSRLVQEVLAADKKVHGAGDVQLSLMAALADVGYKKTLRKLILDPSVKFHPDALYRRCERFAEEKKVSALMTIAECVKDRRHFNLEGLYNMILDVYQREDNCYGALSLWNKMQEEEVTPSQRFIRNLCSLCTANNREIPAELALLLDKESRKARS